MGRFRPVAEVAGFLALRLLCSTQGLASAKSRPLTALFVALLQASIAIGAALGGVVVDQFGVRANVGIGACLFALAFTVAWRTHEKVIKNRVEFSLVALPVSNQLA